MHGKTTPLNGQPVIAVLHAIPTLRMCSFQVPGLSRGGCPGALVSAPALALPAAALHSTSLTISHHAIPVTVLLCCCAVTVWAPRVSRVTLWLSFISPSTPSPAWAVQLLRHTLSEPTAEPWCALGWLGVPWALLNGEDAGAKGGSSPEEVSHFRSCVQMYGKKVYTVLALRTL